MEPPLANPFVGPRPFQELDGPAFAGREAEVDDLLSLLVAHRVVVLHADSGAGKSSLCNAGLVPRLRERGWHIHPSARIGNAATTDGQNPYIADVLASLGFRERQTFDELLDRLSLESLPESDDDLTDPSQTPRVLVIDQVEELFTYVVADQERHIVEFFQQLTRVLESDSRLRALFVIRNDHLAVLLRYSGYVPDEFLIRMDLERLRHDSALAAMKKPLEGTGVEFAPGVAEFVVEQLSRVRSTTGEVPGPYVEPVQLQVVCHEIWAALPHGTARIEREHLRGTADVGTALSRFYEKVVRECTRSEPVREGRLRRWIGDKLITDVATRWAVAAGPESTAGLPNRTVRFLVDRHLLRSEFRAGAHQYELSHDRLIEPIKSANGDWFLRHPWYLVDWKRAVLPLTLVLALSAAALGWVLQVRHEADKAREAIGLEESAWDRRFAACSKSREHGAKAGDPATCIAVFQQLGMELRDLEGSGPENPRLRMLRAVLERKVSSLPASYGFAEIQPTDWLPASSEPNPEFTVEYSAQTPIAFNARDFDARFRALAVEARRSERLDLPLRVRVRANPDSRVDQIRIRVDPNCVLPRGTPGADVRLQPAQLDIQLQPDRRWVAPESSPEALEDENVKEEDKSTGLRWVEAKNVPALVAKGLRIESPGALLARQVVRALRDAPGALFTCRAFGRALAREVRLGHQATLLEALRTRSSPRELLDLMASVQNESPGLLDGSFFDAIITAGGEPEQAAAELNALRRHDAKEIASLDAARLQRPPTPVGRIESPDSRVTFANAVLHSALGGAGAQRQLGLSYAGSTSPWRLRVGTALYKELANEELDWNEEALRTIQEVRGKWYRAGAAILPLPTLEADTELAPGAAQIELWGASGEHVQRLVAATPKASLNELTLLDPTLANRFVDTEAADGILSRMSEGERSWLLHNFSLTDLKLLLRASLSGSKNSSSLHVPWVLRSLVYFYDDRHPASLGELAGKLRAVRLALESTAAPQARSGSNPYATGIATISGAPSAAAMSFHKRFSERNDEDFARALAEAAHSRASELFARRAAACQSGLPDAIDGAIFELEELVQMAPIVAPSLERQLKICLLRAHARRHLTAQVSLDLDTLVTDQDVDRLSPAEALELALPVSSAFATRSNAPNSRTQHVYSALMAKVFSAREPSPTLLRIPELWQQTKWLPHWERAALIAGSRQTADPPRLLDIALLVSSHEPAAAQALLAKAKGALSSEPRRYAAEVKAYSVIASGKLALTVAEHAASDAERQRAVESAHAELAEGRAESARATYEHWHEFHRDRQVDMLEVLVDANSYLGRFAEALELLDEVYTPRGSARSAEPVASPRGPSTFPATTPASPPALGDDSTSGTCDDDPLSLYEYRLDLNLALGKLGDADRAARCSGDVFYAAMTGAILGSDGFENDVDRYLRGPAQLWKDNIRVLAWWRLRTNGRVAQADTLLRSRWLEIDTTRWQERLDLGDSRVWGEKLIAAALASTGEISARAYTELDGTHGEPPPALLHALGYAPHQLESEAYFYSAIIASAVSGLGAATLTTSYVENLRKSVAAKAYSFLEHKLASYLLSVRSLSEDGAAARPSAEASTRGEQAQAITQAKAGLNPASPAGRDAEPASARKPVPRPHPGGAPMPGSAQNTYDFGF